MPRSERKTLLLIAGPTAGGKSALAISLAVRLRGEIVNADAIQVYRDLRILSARPDDATMARVPHHLYGFVPASQRFSAGAWLKHAVPTVRDILKRKRLPIIVGGSGLYFRALTQGLADVPSPSDSVRQDIASRLENLGAPALHRELAQIDPSLAARLSPSDRQRIVRGLEVALSTGKTLSAWQEPQAAPPLPYAHFIKTALILRPQEIDKRCEARARMMIQTGRS